MATVGKRAAKTSAKSAKKSVAKGIAKNAAKNAAKRGAKPPAPNGRAPATSATKTTPTVVAKTPGKSGEKGSTADAAAKGDARPALAVDGTPFPFEIRRSSIQGFGAFATRRLRAGQRLAEYEGERISQKEADRRYAEAGMKRHHTFLFTVDDKTVIDGKVRGNDSRFINHSCEPNVEAWLDDGHIYLHALKNIQAGTELVYDYQYERTEDHTEEDERFYACRCGTPSCRGTILAPKKRSRARK